LPGIAHPGLPRFGGPRPDLPALSQSSAPERPQADEDARLLRRTRIRLMLVSGAMTLMILVVLGVALYNVVASAVEGGATDRLKRVALQEPNGAQGIDIAGDRAGLLLILVPPTGTPEAPPDVSVPAGLPDEASLAAVNQPGDIDIRDIKAGGTPYRVISGYVVSARFAGWKGQWIQNRTVEVAFLNTLGLILIGGGAAALLASLLAGYMYAGRALVPIRQSIDRRQAALQRQREFTANASHELRTPLTIIRASVEDLRRNRRKPVEEVGEALDDIESEVRHVTALVEDMLLLARTDSGVVQLERTELDLADVAAEAAGALVSLGSEHGVSVVLDPLPAPVMGDPMRLRQLVTILVDNAIRHSPSNSMVTVTVRAEDGSALLAVDDQGPGIRAEDMPRLWERFWRADDAPAGGTGLGLAIAKWIVDQHGGTIGAENREEGGARFWVRIPAIGTSGGSIAFESEEPAPPDSSENPVDPNPFWDPDVEQGQTAYSTDPASHASATKV
jgi:signal transduction histidine kinase